MDSPFALPILSDAPGTDGWTQETLRYHVRPRPTTKFKTLLDARTLFGDGEAETTVITRTRAPRDGEEVLELTMRTKLPRIALEDRFCARWDHGMIASKLDHRVGDSRRNEVDFTASPYPFPPATYPEVLLPFLMRGQPREQGALRAAYAWIADRFVVRVYYEWRKRATVEVPAGAIEADLIWMYPDLNDWIALGAIITKLAKPLLPRYEIWFEAAPPHRVVRFEGAYGPPGAPEIVIELAS